MYFLFQCTYYKSSSSGVYFREQVESSQMKVRWEPRETARQGHSPNHEEQSRSGGSTLCQTKIHWLPNGSVVLSQPNHQDKVGHSILTVQFSKGHGPEPELKCNSGFKGKRLCGWGPGMRLRRMILVQSGALSFPPVEIYSSCITLMLVQ